MLSRKEMKRQQKFQDLANQETKDDRIRSTGGDSEYKRRNRIEDAKKSIPLIFLNLLSFLIFYEILVSSVGEAVSIGVSLPSIILVNFIIYFIVSRTYSPPYEKFVVVGHVDPKNTDSAIKIEQWLIPKGIVSRYLISGMQFTLQTVNGLMYFCEQIDFNYDTGNLTVIFGWPNMDEFAFLMDHGIFHNMKESIPLLLKKIQQLEANIEVLVHLEAKDLEAAHFKRIMHVLLDMTKTKSQEDLKRLQEEIDRTTEQINIRLRPKGKAPDVDLNAGGGSDERKDE